MTNVVEFPKINKVIYSDGTGDGNDIRYGDIVQVVEGANLGLIFIAEEEIEGELHGSLFEKGKYKAACERVEWCTVVGEAALMPLDVELENS